jgi:outer membrane lipoprotein carrier protein
MARRRAAVDLFRPAPVNVILRLTLALTLAAVAPLAARAASPTAPPDPEAPGLSGTRRLDALIERVKWEQRRLDSLEAEFVQEKTSEFLARPEISRGSFSFEHPDRVRWEYVSPKPITLVLDGDEMLTWYRDLGRAERMKVGRVSTQVFHYLSANGSLESLLGYFSVTFTPPAAGEPYRLELKPRYARIAKRLASMSIWIDRRLYLPIRVRYVEANGDATEYRLENVRRNVVIPKERFALKLPAGVEVRTVDLAGGRGRGGGSSPQ